jgi:hypothetical protein
MTNKKLLITLGTIFLFIFATFLYKNFIKTPIYHTECGNYSEKDISIGIQNVKAIIADNECKWVLGLSGKDGLKDNEGMFFMFDREDIYTFWMKDMKFPLDIIWINADYKIVGIEKNVSPDTYIASNPQKSEYFGKNYIAQYVFELPAGYSDKSGVKIGDKIKF